MELLTPYYPYLVLVGVSILFYAVCWIGFRKPPKGKGKNAKRVETPAWDAFMEEERRRKAEARPDYGAEMLREAEERERLAEAAAAEAVLAQAQALAMAQQEEAQAGPGKVVEDTGDLTRIMPAINEATHAMPRVTDSLEATRAMRLDPEDLTAPTPNDETRVLPNMTSVSAAAMGAAGAKAMGASAMASGAAGMGSVAVPAIAEGVPGVAAFFRMFGNVNPATAEAVVAITQEAFARLAPESEEEFQALQEDIVVQEALLCMQKAYSTTPTDWMREVALDIFMDVVQQPKSSTTYLVAFDALQILPHLSLGHFQAMSMVLLFKYSRNSNNYTVGNWRHYVRKYVEPFLSDLTVDLGSYMQLDYLRCTMMESTKTPFLQMLVQNYPLVFGCAGFTKEEYHEVLPGKACPSEEVVPSLVKKGYFKLPLVDEGMAARYFHIIGLTDAHAQSRLLHLMKSRPINFEGAAAQETLQDISPVLATLARTYDKSPLGQVSLTLLGLYLARAHVKTAIGETFDLSRWL